MKKWGVLSFSSVREYVTLPPWISGIGFRLVAGFAARLSVRERGFLTFAGIVLGGTLLWLFVVAPLWESHERLRAKITAKERELAEMMVLASTYDALRRELEVVGTANGGALSPFAFLEGLTTSTLGREKLAGINPVSHEEHNGVAQETIELKLSGVSLQELVDLLYKIDATGAALRCTNLMIKKRYKDPYTFDVTLTAIALNPR